MLKGGRIFDLVTGALIKSDVAICNDRIVGTHGDYRGAVEIDVSGKVIVPGFIDTHLHVESSLITPLEFDRCVLAHGVTTAICDPHEIANVLGVPGLQYFLDASMATAMDLRVQLSSCVPATHLETSGARLEVDDLLPLSRHPKVLGLAEFMNFPGVLARDPACLAKLAAFQDRRIDGHSPLLRGLDLNGYLAAGIRTDHETTTAAEALEKLSKGMQILVREGSVSKDLHALASDHHRAQFAVHRALHRRPQSARYRRGRPSRFHDPHRDQPWRAAARRLSRREHFGRAHFRPDGSRPRRAGLARRSRRRRRSRKLRGLQGLHRRAGSSAKSCLRRAARWRRSGAAASRRGAFPRRISSAKGAGPSTQAIGVTPGKIITQRVPVTLPYANGERRDRSRSGYGQGRGRRAAWRQRQYRDRLRAMALA